MSIPEKMVEHLGLQGLRIVIDVREPDEYAGGHVPGGRFVCSCPDDSPAARGTLQTECPWPKPGTKYVGSGNPEDPAQPAKCCQCHET